MPPRGPERVPSPEPRPKFFGSFDRDGRSTLLNLAACQYLDLVKEVWHGASDHDRRVLHDKFHSLHEGEARELLNHLVTTIRHRAIRSG